MRKFTWIVLVLILVMANVPPWIAAWYSSSAVVHMFGRLDGQQINCMAVDGNYFDRYNCLVFNDKLGGRLNYNGGQIYLDGAPVTFPSGKNIGFLGTDGRIQFEYIAAKDIVADASERGGIYYISGKVPKMKHFAFGVPQEEYIQERLDKLK